MSFGFGGFGYEFSVFFCLIEGVSVGSDVWLVGVKVGMVMGIELDLVMFWVNIIVNV